MKETEFNNLVEKLLNEALDEKIAEIKSKVEVTEKKDKKWIQDIDMKEGSFKKYCGGEVTCECVEKAMKAGTGARALNSIVKSSISLAAFNYLGDYHKNNIKVLISEKCIEDPKNYHVF